MADRARILTGDVLEWAASYNGPKFHALIVNRQMKRRDVARTYALAMRSSEPTDWGKVNRAIIERWSESGLIWIKTQATSGKCFKECE